MWLHPVPIGIELGRGGGACNRELPRIPLLGRWVNRGQERFSLSCCDCETHLVCVKALGPWDILYVLIGSAHPPNDLLSLGIPQSTSENAVKAKRAEFTFYALG